MKPPKPSKDEALAALRTEATLTQVASDLGLAYSSLFRWSKRDPDIAAAFHLRKAGVVVKASPQPRRRPIGLSAIVSPTSRSVARLSPGSRRTWLERRHRFAAATVGSVFDPRTCLDLTPQARPAWEALRLAMAARMFSGDRLVTQ